MGCVGALLVGRLTKPIVVLTKAVELVRIRSDYSLHLPTLPTHSNDEVGQLGRGFEAMMAAVRERETDLRQITRFQRTILDNAAYGIISTAPDGIVSSFNPAAERLLGYTADEVVNKLTPVCWHDTEEMRYRASQLSVELGETIAPDFAVFTARARRNLPDETEWSFIRKDGGRVPVLLSVTALRDERGQVTGFVGLVNDLTERKRVENALLFVAQRGLQTGVENFFDALAQFLGEKLSMDYVIIDRIDENPDMAQTVALYAKGSIKPNMCYALKGTPCENVMGRRPCVYRQGVQQLFPEAPLLSEMGAESYIGIPLWDSTGRPIGLIAVMGNRPLPDDAPPVTQLLQLVATRAAAELERKQAEEKIRKLNQELEHRVKERTTQLEAANKELETFSYSVSHDLRTPLRSIDGFSQALLEDYTSKLDEQGQHYLQRVRATAQRMGLLIDDMLNLSRVTRGELTMGNVNLSRLAQEIAEELTRREPERKVSFTIAPEAKVIGDVRFLRGVLENLIGNAWKYTSKRQETKIEFGMMEKDGDCVFFVRDNGAGFDMQYAKRLFGVFQRLHTTEEFPGTGVGLATVQRIIHRHGGRVWAESEVDHGATFYFTLPNR